MMAPETVEQPNVNSFRTAAPDIVVNAIIGVLLADGWHHASDFSFGCYSYVAIYEGGYEPWADRRTAYPEKRGIQALTWTEQGVKYTAPITAILAVQEITDGPVAISPRSSDAPPAP